MQTCIPMARTRGLSNVVSILSQHPKFPRFHFFYQILKVQIKNQIAPLTEGQVWPPWETLRSTGPPPPSQVCECLSDSVVDALGVSMSPRLRGPSLYSLLSEGFSQQIQTL